MRTRTLPLVLAAFLCQACDSASPLDPGPPLAPVVQAGNFGSAGGSGPSDPARPFTGRFEGSQSVTVTPPTASVAVSAAGTATMLGRFTIQLPHTVNLATSTAAGTATLVAANGDEITAAFTGQAQVGPLVHIVEHATVTGGSGRFEGATGSFVITRVFDPAAGRTNGSFAGTISIPRGGD